MAKFSYEEYAKQQASRQQKREAQGSGDRTPVHFLSEYLKGDGDSVVVRFPYKGLKDIEFETIHPVTFPGEKYARSVRCGGHGSCELCEQGIKTSIRFLAKLIVYTVEDGKVVPVCGVWDRPAHFADIDLKAKMQEAEEDFGTTLDNLLVRIRRSGTGLNTTYSLSLSVNNNKTVYNPSVYVADFSILEGVDPAMIMTKSLEQYHAALDKANGVEQPAAEAHTDDKPVSESKKEEETPAVEEVPVTKTPTTPVVEETDKKEKTSATTTRRKYAF